MMKISDANEQVKIVNGKLFFGDMQVQDYDVDFGDAQDEKEVIIPQLYVIRVWNGSYWRFVTGLDLVEKNFWYGGCFTKFYMDQEQVTLPPSEFHYWEYLKGIMDRLCKDTAGQQWAIFLEEPHVEEARETRKAWLLQSSQGSRLTDEG